uniref:Uncharacterized protein n=1 Tax=Lepeophtheirus salmonis TaxID=72036 RepID=A0A0K2T293_LEPSM
MRYFMYICFGVRIGSQTRLMKSCTPLVSLAASLNLSVWSCLHMLSLIVDVATLKGSPSLFLFG